MSAHDESQPSGEVADDSYVSRPGHKDEQVPVVSDQDRVEDPIDGAKADSDEQLARDDRDAIDKSNILGPRRTRGAGPAEGAYREPGDEEGLPPAEDGTSSADVKTAD
ncbi:hypothetical protein F4809DRAFT_636632 [Biscogniauxia mediterranea]|nr:hypothetical protein F4809DRAFT_636632 [Biscogniauxia mediterranea]